LALAQDFFLDLELVLVARVLVVASTAAGVVLAAGLDAMQRRLDDRVCPGSREPGLLLGERCFNFLLRQDKGDEHGFAASVAFIGVRSGGKTGETVATVDQLFDCEEQVLILRHCEGEAAHGAFVLIRQPRDRFNFSGQAPHSA
jgi:hypothetical protein